MAVVRVLLIDDDPDIARIVELALHLRWPDAEFLAAGTGEQGLTLLDREFPTLVILDLGLPDIDGISVLQRLRSVSDVPVILLTARSSEFDKLEGLEKGADDYITKPFAQLEFLARVQAVLRRTAWLPPTETSPPFSSGVLRIDYDRRRVELAGQEVKLTPTEYLLLYHLTKNANRVLSHRTLLAKVWGREYVTETDYLKVHISNLRRKLGDTPGDGSMIQSERGVGYRFIPTTLEYGSSGRGSTDRGTSARSPLYRHD